MHVSLSAVFVYRSFFSISINLWVCLSISLSVYVCVSLCVYISVFFCFFYLLSLSFFSFIYKSIVLIPKRQANVDYILESINIIKKEKTLLSFSLYNTWPFFTLLLSKRKDYQWFYGTTFLLRKSQ